MKVFLAILIALSMAFAQSAKLTNADVIKMLAAGLPESVVIQTIDSSEPAFDTSADGLIALKKAGASDAVIQKVIGRQSRTASPAQPSSSVAGGECKIEADAGGVMAMRAGGAILPMTYQTAKVDEKTGGFLANAFSYGIAKVKAKMTLRIDKERASLRITDKQPELLDLLTPVGSSPDNLYVVRLTVRDSARFVQIGSTEANVVGVNSSSWVMPDTVRVLMTADTLAMRCTWKGKEYSHIRIRPAQPLTRGEYAFIVAIPPRGIGMFDWGVD